MQLADLNLEGSYTYADYLKWNFKERVELIKGRIFKMSPAPNRVHQLLAGQIYYELRTFLKEDQCSVYIAPFDVRLPRKLADDKEVVTVVQPDVCVVCDRSKLDFKGCVGAPDIVVEVLSPANNSVELKNKYEIYEQSGVKEYWVVSPQQRTFLMYTLTDSRYVASRMMAEGDVVTSTVLPGFSIDLTELFNYE